VSLSSGPLVYVKSEVTMPPSPVNSRTASISSQASANTSPFMLNWNVYPGLETFATTFQSNEKTQRNNSFDKMLCRLSALGWNVLLPPLPAFNVLK
jgi:hypothetical protein